MLLLVPLESQKFSTPLFVNGRLISQQSVDSGKIRAIFVQNTLCFAELQIKILSMKIRAQTRYHIWAYFIHGGLFFINAGHQRLTSYN
jgi:hypothetical protein